MVFAILYQQTDGLIVNVDRPDGVSRLRLRHPQFTLAPGYGFGNRQTFLFDVQVCPEQGQQLTSPEAGGQFQVEHWEDSMFLCRP